MNEMTLRPFHPNDAETILGWCKDKQAFRKWSADRYKDFPAKRDWSESHFVIFHVALGGNQWGVVSKIYIYIIYYFIIYNYILYTRTAQNLTF